MGDRCYVAAQGPPGTGKTRTLLALLEVLSRISGEPGRANAMGPILACADTNAATDNLVEGLVERGINVTRLGQPAKVTLCLVYSRLSTLQAHTCLVPGVCRVPGRCALSLHVILVIKLQQQGKPCAVPCL